MALKAALLSHNPGNKLPGYNFGWHFDLLILTNNLYNEHCHLRTWYIVLGTFYPHPQRDCHVARRIYQYIRISQVLPAKIGRQARNDVNRSSRHADPPDSYRGYREKGLMRIRK
ncbi:hypothetical protein [Aquiflexum sp.]|uniref:hypothetical protein n=1 Tax=Aquiflexum sp. TaxID=1872584 RepID=UPI0035940E75